MVGYRHNHLIFLFLLQENVCPCPVSGNKLRPVSFSSFPLSPLHTNGNTVLGSKPFLKHISSPLVSSLSSLYLSFPLPPPLSLVSSPSLSFSLLVFSLSCTVYSSFFPLCHYVLLKLLHTLTLITLHFVSSLFHLLSTFRKG